MYTLKKDKLALITEMQKYLQKAKDQIEVSSRPSPFPDDLRDVYEILKEIYQDE